MGQNSYWEIPSGTVLQMVIVLLQAVKPCLSITVNNSLLFPQLRGRDPASRGDRYMLVNFEDVPYGIKVEFCFRVMSSFTLRRSAVRPTLRHIVIATSIVSRKIFRRSFHTPFKTWPTFCFNVSSKELWVLFIQRGDIWGMRRRGWQTSLLYLFGPNCHGAHYDFIICCAQAC